MRVTRLAGLRPVLVKETVHVPVAIQPIGRERVVEDNFALRVHHFAEIVKDGPHRDTVMPPSPPVVPANAVVGAVVDALECREGRIGPPDAVNRQAVGRGDLLQVAAGLIEEVRPITWATQDP